MGYTLLEASDKHLTFGALRLTCGALRRTFVSLRLTFGALRLTCGVVTAHLWHTIQKFDEIIVNN